MEDVGYLKKKSKKESYLFFVDSTDRNLERYPNPNEYSIRFNSPFKNVYSLEVIDASIPRTQYVIDTHSNTLVYTYNGVEYIIEIPVGDYSDQLLINKLNELFQDKITIDNLSIPASVNNTFLFKSSQVFSFDMTSSTTSEVLGFASNQVYTSSQNSEYFETVTVLNDFSDDSYTFTISKGSFLYQNFSVTEPGILKSFEFNVSTGYTDGIDVKITLGKIDSTSSGFISLSTTVSNSVSSSDNSLISFDFSVDDISLDPSQSGGYYFQIYFVESGSSTTIDPTMTFRAHLTNLNNEILYFGTYNAISAPAVQMSTSDSVDPIYVSTFSTNEPDDINISLDAQIYINVTTETIIAPHIYSLIGDRYIILRCPEIEDHMFRSRAFEKYNMGLAKFKLAVLGYGEERFDYTGLPPRSFHPIGKLDQLSFRFERPNGALYNFRGINHTITFLVKYLTPEMKETYDYSRLNPQYNPDYLAYLQNEKSDTEDSSDEDPEAYEFEKANKFVL